MRKIVSLLFGVALALVPAAQAGEPNAAAKAQAEKLIAQAPDGTAVWTAGDDGSVRHVQSGMKCLPAYPMQLSLAQLAVLPSPNGKGMDVVCDYASPFDGSKLDVFATKSPPGISLDESFELYRRLILALHQGAVAKGAFSDVEGAGLKFPDDKTKGVRTEIFLYKDRAGNDQISYLIVATENGWSLQVRMTVPAADKEMSTRLFAYMAMDVARKAVTEAATPSSN